MQGRREATTACSLACTYDRLPTSSMRRICTAVDVRSRCSPLACSAIEASSGFPVILNATKGRREQGDV